MNLSFSANKLIKTLNFVPPEVHTAHPGTVSQSEAWGYIGNTRFIVI